MNIAKTLLFLTIIFIATLVQAQTNYYGLTSKGGNSGAGVIFKTDTDGTNLQTVFDFDYHNSGRSPKSVFTQASNGKIYGTTQFGGSHLCSFPWYQYQKYSGVIFEYDPSTDIYNVLFNFNDTNTGCWPNSAPVLASNGKLYGVTPGIGGFSQHYGTVYSYELSTGIYTKIHSFINGSSDGQSPVGNLLLAADGKLYGLTRSGGFNDKGIIFTIDPATDTYINKLDLRNGSSGNKAAQNPKTGLIQAPDGMMYGTSSQGGNYPSGYSYAYGNIFKYNPTTNVATNLYGFNNVSLGSEPEGAPVLVGTNNLYCITSQTYQIPGTSSYEFHSYLWKYTISTGTAIVVDSIANGKFNSDIVVNTNGEIIITGNDYNITNATYFWKFDPTTNMRTILDTSINVGNFSRGLMLSSNGKYYAGGLYNSNTSQYNSGNGSFIEYDAINHNIVEKFKFSDPIDGINPKGDLMMATNGKLYGTTSEGGDYNKGVVFEFNPSNGKYIKKFDFDSLSGYAPKDGLMEASNGKFYVLTFNGGTTGDGTLIEIDTTNWTMLKKVDFSNAIGRKSMGKVTEAWDGMLYGLTAYDGGGLFQYNIATGVISQKYSFIYDSGTFPQGSLMLANNGKLYGLTNNDGAIYYSKGTFFEYDPIADTLIVKQELFPHLGYFSAGNTPLQASNGIIYTPITAAGGYNAKYEGGTIDAFDGTQFTNKAIFSVSNTGSKPMGDLMESANGKFYGYTYQGGANDYGTVFEFNASSNTITKKVDFDNNNGANPMHGSMTEVGLSDITITQQPVMSSTCIDDIAVLSVAATHTTLLHYQWYENGNLMPGATYDTLNFAALLAADGGTYFCKITGGAKAVISDSFVLTTSTKLTVSMDAIAKSYCLNDADVNLTALPTGGSFSGSGVSGSVFSPVNAGVGNIEVIYSYTNATGCSNSDTINIVIKPSPDASFTGLGATYCNNADADNMIVAETGGTFFGTTSENVFDPKQIVIPSNALSVFKSISYVLTNTNGCKDSITNKTIIYPLPNVDFGALTSTICHNGEPISLTLGTPAGGSYSGNGVQGDSFIPADAPLGNNTLIYSFTNTNICTNKDSVVIDILSSPEFTLGNDTTICMNHNIILSTELENGYVYLWNDGTTDSIISIDGATLGVGIYPYSVIVTNQFNNCNETDEIIITVDICTGIESSDDVDNQISIYPNPSSGIFNIASDIIFETMDIYSTDGRLILSQDINRNMFEINLNKQSKGVYYLLLYNFTTAIHKQLIIR